MKHLQLVLLLLAFCPNPAHATFVEISSTPDSAEVYINGTRQEPTPSLLDLTPGNYDLTIKKDGYRTVSRKLQVTEEIAEIHINLERGAGAISGSTSDSDEDSARRLYRKAGALYKDERKPEALATLEKAIRADERFEPARKLYAQILVVNDDLEGAIREFEILATLNPREAVYRFDLGRIQRHLKDYGKAIFCYRTGLELEENSEARFALAELYQMTRQNNEALESFRTYLRNEPDGKKADYARIQIERLRP